jgi:hypothetical protein
VVYLNLQNACEGALPFYVAVDGPRRAVVVAVRGTFSIEDTVTDVLCLPVNVAGWLPPFMKVRSHVDQLRWKAVRISKSWSVLGRLLLSWVVMSAYSTPKLQ